MTPQESNEKFAAAKVSGKRTGCAPTKGRTTKTWRLKALEVLLVHNGVPITTSRNGDSYEVKLFERKGTQYRKVIKVTKG